MAEYSDRIDVAAPADAVFAFISDIGNLPKYLPTVHGAHAHGTDRVEVDGTANGHQYASTGWLKSDPATRLMSWGSDGENDYAGKMTVQGRSSASQVECTLASRPRPPQGAMDEHQADAEGRGSTGCAPRWGASSGCARVPAGRSPARRSSGVPRSRFGRSPDRDSGPAGCGVIRGMLSSSPCRMPTSSTSESTPPIP